MPRHPRIVVPHVVHHVYLRGNNRRRLFSSVSDRLRFIGYLMDAIEHTGCAVHQLTLMSNHVHLLALPPTVTSLSELVARTCQPYAQKRNRARDASGKLFEQRFHSHAAEDVAAVMTMTLYNDANPFRVGLASTPYGAPWSTGPLHAGEDGGRIPRRLWTPSRWYLSLAADDAGRGRRYRELMDAYIAASDAKRAAAGAGDVRYTKRLERPDRSCAREPAPWLRGA